ncbi:MAG: family 2 glycosyl transferase [Opitutae bacterium]|nr:family 2 glycosyl transferase [Opitutae bacterium]
MFFSVVIPTFERPEDLYQALDALSPERQTYPKAFQVIVSDDSSDQRSKKMIEEEFRGVTWTQGKKNGPAGNRNSGAKISKGDWLIFIDDDCIPEPTFIQSYEQAIIKNSHTSVFEGRIFPDRERKTWAEGCPENSSGGMLWTSNLCIKKSVFEDLGGFDERFRIAYEDVEFAHRLKQNKIKSLFIPKAAVCHPWRSLRKGGKNWKTKGYQIESLLLFLEKHEDARKEFGNPNLYLKNFLRIMSKTLLYCLFSLRGRGIDVLFAEAFVSLQTSIILTFNIKK